MIIAVSSNELNKFISVFRNVLNRNDEHIVVERKIPLNWQIDNIAVSSNELNKSTSVFKNDKHIVVERKISLNWQIENWQYPNELQTD